MGVYLSQPDTKKIEQQGTFKHLKFAACSMQGWRTGMEDSHIIDVNVSETVQVFGVFDGHGGKEVAIFVDKHFTQELKKNDNFKKEKMQLALEETFLKMDILLNSAEGKKEIQKIKSGDKNSNGGMMGESFAGCTANVALLHNFKDLYIANAGDSRTVLCSNGDAVEMSKDHKPEDPGERARIQKAGGYISEGRINGNLNLSRAIGDLEYKKDKTINQKEQLIIAFPDVQKRTLSSTDEFILMGCDGIWEVQSNQELIKFCRDRLKKKVTIQTVLQQLLDSLLAKDTASGFGCDNMTSLIVQFKEI